MNPLVSILIPAYNAEKWIASTIRSALAQTWKHKEILVIDDGSTDKTLEVAKRFEAAGVFVVSQDNRGAAAARNKAFAVSSGEYIQWLDADDLLGSEKISAQMDLVRSGRGMDRRTLLSCAWGRFMYRPKRAVFAPTKLWCDLSPAEFLVRKLEHKVFMQTATWLVSRELVEAAGAWDTTMLSDDDGEYFCRVLLASNGVRFVRDARVYYRSIGRARLSYVGRSNRKLEALWRSIQLHVGYLRSLEDSERSRAACLKHLQNYVIDFYPLRMDIVEEMREYAKALGGELEYPRLSWKYSWIRRMFGWSVAQRATLVFPRVRWSVAELWDLAMFGIRGESAEVV